MRHGDGFDAEEDENLVEGREVGHEMREDGRHAGDELGVYESDAADTFDPEGLSEAEEPVDGDFVLDVELVPLERPVVPRAHRGEEA